MTTLKNSGRKERTPLVIDLAALIEKMSLGSAGVCVVIILAITEVSAPLDWPLRLSVWFSFPAVPMFVSVYLAKDEILRLMNSKAKRASMALNVSVTISFGALLLLVASLTMLGSHFSPCIGLVFFFLTLFSIALPEFLRKMVS